ncbi:DNA-binding response regulator [Saccharibacillus sp. O16]|nr:DNA-binding response regulator [Saccharibacillus sp. O16]
MHRLLIVDDEEIITDSLHETLAGLMPEQLDVCKAYSAREALEWMARTRIDIVMTDIRMPGMDGLEMAERIRAYWPRCRIVFLTGYSDFDYAYRALQMPDARYLLKTEGYAKVTAMIEQIVEEIRRSHRMDALLERSQELAAQLQKLEREDYLRMLLRSVHAAGASPEEWQSELEQKQIPLSASEPVQLVLGRLDSLGQTSAAQLHRLLASARVIAASLLEEHVRQVSVADARGDVVWLIQPKCEDIKLDGAFARYLEGALELVQEACVASLGVSWSFAVSGQSCAWTDITRRYERLKQLQWMKVGDGVNMVLIDQGEELPKAPPRELGRPGSRIEAMSGYLETGRTAAFYESFEKVTEELLLPETPLEEAMETYYSLALMLYATVSRWGLSPEIPDRNRLLRLEEQASMKEAVQLLYETADRLVRFKSSDEQERAHAVIRSLCDYIREHLDHDLSLVRLAERYHFNPSYLSRFFKQEMGLNLSEFIDDCRIREAKRLLTDPHLMVREVAVQVGYEAAHSFTRFFKKVTGMTPQEFKDAEASIHSRSEATP